MNEQHGVAWAAGGLRVRRMTAAAGLVAALAFGRMAAAAPWIRITNDPATSTNPDVCGYSGQGDLSLVWIDTRTGAGDVYFMRVDPSGARRLAQDVRISTSAAAASNPACAVDSSGNTYIVWEEGNAAWYVKVDSAGATLVPTKQLDTVAAGDHMYPRIDVESNGTAHIGYATTRIGREVWYVSVNAAGTSLCSRRVENDISGGNSTEYPDIAAPQSAGGSAAMTYRGYDFFGNQPLRLASETCAASSVSTLVNNLGSTARTAVAGGAPPIFFEGVVSGQWHTLSYLSGNSYVRVDQGIGPARDPGLATLGGVDYLSTWEDARSGTAEVYARGINGSTKQPAATECLVSAAGSASQRPAVGRAAAGLYAVVWDDMVDGQAEIYLRFVGSNCGEICNGVDDDGDTSVDEGCDDDLDGYCDASMATIGAPPVCVHGAGDCDDTKAGVHPGAVEICDGIDNQCPGDPGFGQVDEGLGQTSCGVFGCQRTVNNCEGGVIQTCVPGVPTEEICDNVDNNCDGVVDNDVSVPNWAVDTDGDGLSDCEEIYGVSATASGQTYVLDLKSLGADRLTPDVFVEIDYMSCEAGAFPGEIPELCTPTHAPHIPNGLALAQVWQSFKRHGVNLHFDLSQAEKVREKQHVSPDDLYRIQYGVALPAGGDFNQFNPDAICSNPDAAYFGTSSQRHDQPRCPAIMTARGRVFRYALFGHRWEDSSLGRGLQHCPGRVFFLASARIAEEEYWATVLHGTTIAEEDIYYQAAGFMHELGHTLGLAHGGGDETGCKPNYLSVMSYARAANSAASAWKLPGIADNQSIRLASISDATTMARWLDYSDAQLTGLDEVAGLDESLGVGFGARVCSGSPSTACSSDGQCPAGQTCGREPRGYRTLYCGSILDPPGLPEFCAKRLIGPSGVPMDWNHDGDTSDPAVTLNVNHIDNLVSGMGCGGEGTSLVGHDDWRKILGSTAGQTPGCISLTSTVSGLAQATETGSTVFPQEQTVDEYLNAILGGDDPDADGVATPQDNCAAVSNASQTDSDADGRGDACDCQPNDSETWDRPSNAQALGFTNHTSLRWEMPAYEGTSTLLYDVLRSGSPSNFVGATTCVESGGSDTVAVDLDVPAPGTSFFYLVRGKSGCASGEGPLGEDSSLAPRAGRSCSAGTAIRPADVRSAPPRSIGAVRARD